jgi:hypothetical protein
MRPPISVQWSKLHDSGNRLRAHLDCYNLDVGSSGTCSGRFRDCALRDVEHTIELVSSKAMLSFFNLGASLQSPTASAKDQRKSLQRQEVLLLADELIKIR